MKTIQEPAGSALSEDRRVIACTLGFDNEEFTFESPSAKVMIKAFRQVKNYESEQDPEFGFCVLYEFGKKTGLDKRFPTLDEFIEYLAAWDMETVSSVVQELTENPKNRKSAEPFRSEAG